MLYKENRNAKTNYLLYEYSGWLCNMEVTGRSGLSVYEFLADVLSAYYLYGTPDTTGNILSNFSAVTLIHKTHNNLYVSVTMALLW